jgi:hypothetical protein
MSGSNPIVRLLIVVIVVMSAWTAQGQTVVSGLDAGGAPEVSVFDLATKELQVTSFFAYAPSFGGGVRVAVGDVNGDGVADIITGAGPGGGAHVKVFDGNTGAMLHSFLAFDGFGGGIFVAAGDVNGDGTADIIVGAGGGALPHVKVFNGNSAQELQSFFAYDPAFRGGVTVAAGDVNGDGHADVITGTGPGSLAHVKVFAGASNELLASFFAFGPSFQGGVFVAAGDVNGDGRADVVAGAGPGAGPHVRVFNAAGGSELASFFAFDADFTGGVRVAAGDVSGDGIDDLIVAAGPGGGPHVKVFRGDTLALLHSFLATAPTFTGGVFVAAGTVTVTTPRPDEKLTILTRQVQVAFPNATQLLQNAAAKIEGGETHSACGMLNAFQNRVAAQSGKQLSAAQATHFVLSSGSIKTTLECR